MTHVSLFTGIGGLDLAAEAAGINTVLQVERDPYCLRVLEKHWPDVPRITDIKEVHADDRWRNPTVVSGGFPCQPFSHAGKRGGTGDDRYLWPEMLRVIRELGPTWVVGENVSGLLSIESGMVFESVCADLEREGYEVLTLHYPAAGVGAPHKRDRVFIVANTLRERESRQKQAGGTCKIGQEWPSCEKDLFAIIESPFCESSGFPPPLVCRGDDGVPSRVDRLRVLGNAVVPAQACPIFHAIAMLTDPSLP